MGKVNSSPFWKIYDARIKTRVERRGMGDMMNVGVDSAINIWHYDHLPGEIKEIMQLNAISDCDLDWVALMPEIYHGGARKPLSLGRG